MCLKYKTKEDWKSDIFRFRKQFFVTLLFGIKPNSNPSANVGIETQPDLIQKWPERFLTNFDQILSTETINVFVIWWKDNAMNSSILQKSLFETHSKTSGWLWTVSDQTVSPVSWEMKTEDDNIIKGSSEIINSTVLWHYADDWRKKVPFISNFRTNRFFVKDKTMTIQSLNILTVHLSDSVLWTLVEPSERHWPSLKKVSRASEWPLSLFSGVFSLWQRKLALEMHFSFNRESFAFWCLFPMHITSAINNRIREVITMSWQLSHDSCHIWFWPTDRGIWNVSTYSSSIVRLIRIASRWLLNSVGAQRLFRFCVSLVPAPSLTIKTSEVVMLIPKKPIW